MESKHVSIEWRMQMQVGVIGAAPIDAGRLMHARYTEPACMLLVQLAYTQSFGTQIGLTLAAIPS
jgi:predicted dinucleotide-binding enzyme